MMLTEGVGITFYGDRKRAVENGQKRLYAAWSRMFYRCYSKAVHRDYPTYIGCSVDERFHRLVDFLSWAEHQVGHNSEGFQLDKDILRKGNKVYGPDTCCFIPKEINTLLSLSGAIRGEYPIGVGKLAAYERFFACVTTRGKRLHIGLYDTPEIAFMAYKAKKEEIVKEMAIKHKASICHRVFDALMNYQVEITD